MQTASQLSTQLTPLALHFLALAGVFALASAFRAKSRTVRLALALLLFAGLLGAGLLKTSSDENLFRLLRVDRGASVRDIQAGLDRLEASLEEDAVLELEASLTGNSSAYYFKGRLG